MTILLMLCGVFLLYVLQAHYYKKKWSDALSVDIGFADSVVNEGDTSSLTEVIINRKILPLTALQINFHVNRNLKFTETENTITTDNNYRTDIFSVMSYEKIQRTIPFECKRRGYYRIDKMNILSHDLFFKRKSALMLPVNTSLYVYPMPVDMEHLDVPFKKLLGTILTRRYAFTDPFEFRGIRQYRTGDSLKDINWKASARTGEYMVNVHNYTAAQQVTILLNLSVNSRWRQTDIFETSIRIAASYSERLISAGIPTKLVTNGLDIITKKSTVINHGAGSHHITAIKEALSRIDPDSETEDFLAYIEGENGAGSNSTLYIFISSAQNQLLMEGFNRLCAGSEGSQWIAPMHRDMTFLPERCLNAEAFKWEVNDFE